MIRKFVTVLIAAAVLAAAGGAVYADSCGVFLKDNDAARALVNKYMSYVMRSYRCEEDVSFHGVVKEGCDFWYYNDYNNDLICETSKSCGGAESADFSVSFDSVKYADHCYTIEARVYQTVKYADEKEALCTACRHTFTVEQNGRYMYITNDICDGTDKLLAPVQDAPETADTAAEK